MYEVITINLINLQFICLLNATKLFLTNKRQNARGLKFCLTLKCLAYHYDYAEPKLLF